MLNTIINAIKSHVPYLNYMLLGEKEVKKNTKNIIVLTLMLYVNTII
jgi:hypothetical protein